MDRPTILGDVHERAGAEQARSSRDPLLVLESFRTQPRQDVGDDRSPSNVVRILAAAMVPLIVVAWPVQASSSSGYVVCPDRDDVTLNRNYYGTYLTGQIARS
jgi:hypothetical protein